MTSDELRRGDEIEVLDGEDWRVVTYVGAHPNVPGAVVYVEGASQKVSWRNPPYWRRRQVPLEYDRERDGRWEPWLRNHDPWLRNHDLIPMAWPAPGDGTWILTFADGALVRARQLTDVLDAEGAFREKAEAPIAGLRGQVERLTAERDALRNALTAITQPPVRWPGDGDIVDWLTFHHGTEGVLRAALIASIRAARAALGSGDTA